MSKGAGTERVLATLSNQLVEKGYEIDILSCQKGYKSHFQLVNSINLYSLEGEKYSNSILRRLANILKIRKICKKNSYHFIVFVDVALAIYLPFIKNKNTKFISWEHFNYFAITGSRLQKFARTLSSRFCDAVVVITKDDYKNYTANEKRINKIVQIYNPISISKTMDKVTSRENVILAVGRLEPQKNFIMLLDAWKQASIDLNDWSLCVVGEGSQKTELELKIINENIENVFIKGYSQDIKMEYQKASILVCSSLFEGFGMVLIEAQANELPVISFDCPVGPREIIENNVNGILVQNGDITELANAIVKLALAPDKRKQLSINALESIKEFDVDKITQKWEKLFLELLEKK